MATPLAVLELPTTPSTLDAAAALVKAGDARWQAVRTDEQTAGRGRQGRTWHMFPGHSLACTLLLPGPPVPHLALLAVLALHDAITTLCPTLTLPLHVKWPNDLLLGFGLGQGPSNPDAPKKLSGLLIETAQAPGGATHTLLGVGLNLTESPAMLALGQGFPGIALARAVPPGQPVPTAAALLVQLSTCLSARLALYHAHGWAPNHNDYVRHCITLGQRIVWQRSENPEFPQELTGLARGLTEGGHLEMVTDDGMVHIIQSGSVMLHGRHHT
jgi:BirA family transcriptional regulator, biotin operon repressor / biotin---[acetyl-CoA-carboxylase] ligase